MKNLPPLPKTSLLGQIGLALSSILVVATGFAVASLLFAVLLVAGVVLGGWLWWQYRRLARQARTTEPAFIDAEYTVVSERSVPDNRRLPPPTPPRPASGRARRRAS